MAAHIKNIRESGIRQVTKEQFYQELQWGDLIFCQGNYLISKAIQMGTGSPFSHVLMAWLPPSGREWLTLESTASKGVHVGRLTEYVDIYNGDLVIARRTLSTDDRFAALNTGFSVLEDAYDWQQEVSTLGHKLLKCLPVVQPQREYFCSGLQYLMSTATSIPLQNPGPSLPTPEQNWTDPSVVPVCAFIK